MHLSNIVIRMIMQNHFISPDNNSIDAQYTSPQEEIFEHIARFADQYEN